MQHGSVSSGDAVDVLVDQHLIVASVEGVVEHRRVQPNHYACRNDRPIKRNRIADLCRHRVVNPLVLTALVDMRARRVTEDDMHADPSTSFGGEEPHQFSVFGDEQTAVDEDANLVYSVFEQAVPDRSRYGSPMGI